MDTEETLELLRDLEISDFFAPDVKNFIRRILLEVDRWTPTGEIIEYAKKLQPLAEEYLYEEPISLWHGVKSIFHDAVDEQFYDGMDSKLSLAITAIVEKHGDEAVHQIADLINMDMTNDHVDGEALRCLGRIEGQVAYYSRRQLLEECLTSDFPDDVRDSAALGLASLDDPHSIPYLEKSICVETHDELRQDLQQVLDQLLDTRMSNDKAKTG